MEPHEIPGEPQPVTVYCKIDGTDMPVMRAYTRTYYDNSNSPTCKSCQACVKKVRE